MTSIITVSDPGLKAARAFRKSWDNKEFSYGMTIPKEWVETAMGMSDDDISTAEDRMTYRGQWMRAMSVFRSYLLNEMKILVVNGSDPAGYYLVRPEEQTEYAVHGFRQAVARASRKSSEIADNTNVDVLSPTQRQEAADQRALLRRMQSAIGGVIAVDEHAKVEAD